MQASEPPFPQHGHAQPHLSLVDSDLGRNHKDPDQLPGRCLIQVLGQQPSNTSLRVQNRVYIVSPRHLPQSWRMLHSILLSLVLLALWTLAARRWNPFAAAPSIVHLGIAFGVSWAFTGWQAGKAIVAEKLTVIRGVGLQTESALSNGSSTNHLFLPMSNIRSVFIHEVMTRWHFKFVLAVALSDTERPIQLLFEGQDLRLWQLQALYNNILDSFQLDLNGMIPIDE